MKKSFTISRFDSKSRGAMSDSERLSDIKSRLAGSLCGSEPESWDDLICCIEEQCSVAQAIYEGPH